MFRNECPLRDKRQWKNFLLGGRGGTPSSKNRRIIKQITKYAEYSEIWKYKKNEKKGPLNRLPSGEGEGYLGLLDLSTKIMLFFLLTPSQRGTYIFILNHYFSLTFCWHFLSPLQNDNVDLAYIFLALTFCDKGIFMPEGYTLMHCAREIKEIFN